MSKSDDSKGVYVNGPQSGRSNENFSSKSGNLWVKVDGPKVSEQAVAKC